MTITEFLLARIAEDEAEAHEATPGPWEWSGTGDELSLAGDDDTSVISAAGMHTEGYLYVSIADRVHIARYDPARVLAECAAKRAIIGQWEHAISDGNEVDMARAYDETATGIQLALRETLRALAAIYADHPGYRQEWAC